VLLAVGEVGQQRLGGRLTDRDDATAPALAASDGDQPRDEVEVVEVEVDELARAG